MSYSVNEIIITDFIIDIKRIFHKNGWQNRAMIIPYDLEEMSISISMNHLNGFYKEYTKNFVEMILGESEIPEYLVYAQMSIWLSDSIKKELGLKYERSSIQIDYFDCSYNSWYWTSLSISEENIIPLRSTIMHNNHVKDIVSLKF